VVTPYGPALPHEEAGPFIGAMRALPAAAQKNVARFPSLHSPFGVEGDLAFAYLARRQKRAFDLPITTAIFADDFWSA
jgi:hypothetical protein